MRQLCMVQNIVKINKNGVKYFFHAIFYGRPKELFDFNKLANYFFRLFLNDIIFAMKLFKKNYDIHIPDFSFNKRDFN